MHRLTTALLVSGFILSQVLAQSIHPDTSAGTASADLQIASCVTRNLRDLTVIVKKVDYNARAGEKVSKEFGMLNQLVGTGTLRYKAPNRIRVDGKLLGTKGAFVMDGMTQRIRVGAIHKTLDESRAPGKITTLLDLGLISDFYLSYTSARYQGIQTIDGIACRVFRLTFAGWLEDTSSRLVWVDPQTRITLRREEYRQDGTRRVVFHYRSPVRVAAGIWLPSVIEAENSDGQKIGEILLQSIQANQGLDDSLFD